MGAQGGAEDIRTLPGPGRFGWFVLVVVAAAGYGVVASRSPATPSPQPTGDVAIAANAVDMLLAPASGHDVLAALPSDFTEVTGVRPVREPAGDGTVRTVHASGGCSTPWGDDDTEWDFGPVCRSHDLGYDLLRYAATKGQPLGQDARRRLDTLLSTDMRARCERIGATGTCRLVADLYSMGLVANSWHQRWGPPRTEPIGGWSIGLIVVITLLAVRVPVLGRRRTGIPRDARIPLSPQEETRARFAGVLRLAGLAGVVFAESVLAFAPFFGVPAVDLWPVTWLFQLVPLFLFAGGHANLLAWRATVATGGSFGDYLAGRLCWLIRPVLAFVTAWLAVPLSLDLLVGPDQRLASDAVAAFGRLVVQPLWLLALYLLVVVFTPAMHWLHRRDLTPSVLAVLAAVVVVLGSVGGGSTATYVGGIVLAIGFNQVAFLFADGTLGNLRRAWPAALACGAAIALVVLTTVGGLPRMLIAEPMATASFAPSMIGVLLVGVVQVCGVVLLGERGAAAVAASWPVRAVAVARSAPMTMYLTFLCVMLVVAGIAATGDGEAQLTALAWLSRPSTLLAIALLAVPTALAFVLFERGSADQAAEPAPRPDRWTTVLAAALGVGYGTIGVLAFAATGIGGTQAPVLLGLALDPMSGIIHLLLGWYLLHSAWIGTTATPGPWLLTAAACVPPIVTVEMIAPSESAGVALLHGVTIAIAVVAAVTTAAPAYARLGTTR